MRKELFYCDKCNKEVGNQYDLMDVSIEAKLYLQQKTRDIREYLRLEICQACADKVGLIKKVVKNDEIVPEKNPDIKDKLFEVIAELVAELVEETQ